MTLGRAALAMLTLVLLASCSQPAGTASAPASTTPSAPPSSAPSASDAPASAPASVEATPSATPSPTPSPTPQPTPLAVNLPVPGFVTVSADALLVREAPGLAAAPLIDRSNCIDNPNPCERPFTLGNKWGYLWGYVFDGPVRTDGYDWYLLATEMNTPQRASTHPSAVGWVAAGDATNAWLVADDRPCPSEPIELADVTNLALTKLEMLHCIGDQQLTLTGWLPGLPSSEDDPDMSECRETYHWLTCGSIFDLIRPVERGWAGNADYLDFVIDPSTDVVVPERGQWVTVIGAFDHPEAADCGDVAAVLICRFSFVVSSIASR